MIHKTIKKVASILPLVLFCFLIAGCTKEPPAKGKAIMSTDDLNKEAVQAVLESEFTAPNAEYNLIVQNLDKKWMKYREEKCHRTQLNFKPTRTW